MPNYIAVDCGKFETKVNAKIEGKKDILQFKLRTKMSKGIFADDMIKQNTVITQVDGEEILMYGFGASTEPSMETSKKTDIHRIGTLTAIAIALGEGTFDEVYVAIGVPLAISGNPAERMAYKDFILGPDNATHTVNYKAKSDGPVQSVTFTIRKRFVYPEGSGVLWVYPSMLEKTSNAIIDIGNVNSTCVFAQGLLPEESMCFSNEYGGKSLIAGLSMALESELGSRVSESLVASVLTKQNEDRRLISVRGDKSVEERSAQIIADYTLNHVKMIRQQCDIHHWPIDFSNVVCVGGTSRLLLSELKTVFGETAFVPENQEYMNVIGFLKRMCASLGVDIKASKAA